MSWMQLQIVLQSCFLRFLSLQVCTYLCNIKNGKWNIRTFLLGVRIFPGIKIHNLIKKHFKFNFAKKKTTIFNISKWQKNQSLKFQMRNNIMFSLAISNVPVASEFHIKIPHRKHQVLEDSENLWVQGSDCSHSYNITPVTSLEFTFEQT